MKIFFRRAKHALTLLCFAAALAAPRNAGAIAFDPSNNLIFSSMTAQAVVPAAGGEFRMYLTSGGYQVLSATSTDMVAWSLESGVRLSTSTADVDRSSITSCGIYLSTNAADPMRMYYVAVSSLGLYRILSATSTDGLTWSKQTSTHVINNGGLGFLDSPRPFSDADGLFRLYYITDGAGGNARANYRIHTASSSDPDAFVDDGAIAALSSKNAYQVSVTSLTDGRRRLYYAEPLVAGSTGAQVVSALAASGSLAYAIETSSIQASTFTSLSELSYPVVVRSTEGFRWRMFYSLSVDVASTPFTTSAVTSSPTLASFDPSSIMSGNVAAAFTVTGEMFSTGLPALSFVTTGDSMSPATLTRADDLTLTGTLNTAGKKTGPWILAAANADGAQSNTISAFTMTLMPAEVSIVDNMFRPLGGGKTTISLKTFESGRVTIKLYSQNGAFIRTLLDEDRAGGVNAATWNGTTLSGQVVSSGVYLLTIQAPGAKLTKKIVVIK